YLFKLKPVYAIQPLVPFVAIVKQKCSVVGNGTVEDSGNGDYWLASGAVVLQIQSQARRSNNTVTVNLRGLQSGPLGHNQVWVDEARGAIKRFAQHLLDQRHARHSAYHDYFINRINRYRLFGQRL